jgi:hypothetical protein
MELITKLFRFFKSQNNVKERHILGIHKLSIYDLFEYLGRIEVIIYLNVSLRNHSM